MDFRDDLQRKRVLPMVMSSLLLVLLPLFQLVPWWVSTFSVVVILFAWFVRRTLPAIIRFTLVILVIAAVVTQHKALMTREAGLSLIVLMISFKLLETKTYRDAMLILSMVFFLVFTGFLLQADLGTSLYLIVCTPVALAAVLQINQHKSGAAFSSVFRGAGRLLLLALPMMLAFYFFFPRLAIPLWVLPGGNGSGTTGFSENLSLGDISSLALNDDLAFRVDFDGEIPPAEQRYWRSVMLSEFDGFNWKISDFPFQHEKASYVGTEYRYRITLQPHRGRWLPVLDVPVETTSAAVTVGGQMLRLGYQLRSVMNYKGVSRQISQFGVQLSPEERSRFLQLPANGNPRAQRFGQQLRERLRSNEQIVGSLMRQINQELFYYTLNPPLLQEDLIDDFWFNQRRGFCEHYAAATAYILRAAGVPSRVIGGYQGGNLNAFGNYLSVLQSDAHAWVEYWHEEKGWKRLDPTAAIDPQRVESDLRRQLSERDGLLNPTQWASALFNASGFDLVKPLRDNWQLANQWFDSNIVQFNKQLQRDWLAGAGLGDLQQFDLIRMLVVSVFVGLAIAAWFLLRPHRSAEPLLRCYQRFEQHMGKHGVTRTADEPPLHFFDRCQQQLPARSVTIASFARHYLAMRFGAAATDVRLLKLLLRQMN